MRLVSILDAGPDGEEERLAFLDGDSLLDPLVAVPPEAAPRAAFRDAVAFIRAGEPARAAVRRMLADPAAPRRPAAGVRLGAPIRPSTVLCTGSNYRAHNREKANTPISGKEPEFFVKTSDCVIGPEEGIVHEPRVTRKLDCETELAVVIGRAGRHIPVESALDHVFGYAVANDVTARDRQVRRSPEGSTFYDLGRGKVFDTSLPLGPLIATADEVGDPQTLMLTTRINGELRQSSSTADMIWSVAEIVHFFSVNLTLRPGMVIITGTPAGTAWSADADLGGSWHPTPGLIAATRYCEPGDVVESAIERIGTLRNPVVAA